MWVSKVDVFRVARETEWRQNRRQESGCQLVHFATRKAGPREVSALAKATGKVSDTPGQECWAWLWSVPHFVNRLAFCRPASCDGSWEGISHDRTLPRLYMGDWGARREGTLCHSGFPVVYNAHSLMTESPVSPIHRWSLRKHENKQSLTTLFPCYDLFTSLPLPTSLLPE